MFAAGADPSAEHTQLHRESRAREFSRRALQLGRSTGARFYLITVGLTATWVIAVFFGVGLFVLVPRPAQLAFGTAPKSSTPGAPAEEASWLLQSANRLEQLSTSPASSPPQPTGAVAVENTRAAEHPADQDAVERNSRSDLPDPRTAHAANAPPDQRTVPALFAGTATGETGPEPSAEERARTLVVAPGTAPTPHPSSSRKKASQKPANGRPRTSRPPTRAIQDVLQKHSRLLK